MTNSIIKPVRTVIVDGGVIDYHWIYGRVTLTWKNVLPDWKMATGLVRAHYDADNIPGDWHSCLTVIVNNGHFESEMFIKPKDITGYIREFRAFYNYLENDLGLIRVGHIRAKTGKKLRTVPA